MLSSESRLYSIFSWVRGRHVIARKHESIVNVVAGEHDVSHCIDRKHCPASYNFELDVISIHNIRIAAIYRVINRLAGLNFGVDVRDIPLVAFEVVSYIDGNCLSTKILDRYYRFGFADCGINYGGSFNRLVLAAAANERECTEQQRMIARFIRDTSMFDFLYYTRLWNNTPPNSIINLRNCQFT